MKQLLLAPIAAISLTACATIDQTEFAPASNVKGAVSAADPRAQAAGEEILRRGGNATDAAIAVMLALTVVEPQSSGIGGGGFLVRGDSAGTVQTYDGRETSPAGATPDWFLAKDGSVPDFMESVRSGLSVGVPGNVALAAQAHAEHGTLDWATLFEPAIRLAREGFQVNPRLHGSLSSARDRAAFTQQGRAIYYDAAGNPPAVGSLLRNEELARTLEAIAEAGPEAFYRGENASRLVTTVSNATPRQGAMTVADVNRYAAKLRAPVCSEYRLHRICAMGPPTSGGVAVLQILGQLERFDLSALGVDNPVTWHLFLESQRLAYADRELYLADPDFVSVPVAGLIDRNYLAQRSTLIDAGSRMDAVQPGVPSGVTQAWADGNEPEEKGTSHLAVVDAAGTMISYTSTIEGAFGSGLVTGGYFLNNELTDFSRQPVVDGKPVANRVEGGKRPRSSMSPVVVYDPQGEPMMAVGAAGGSTIPVQTARSIIGVIDFGLDAEDALGLPFVMAFGDEIMLEQGTWLETAAGAFRALGHTNAALRPAPVKAGIVLRRGGAWHSARDPRIEEQLELP
ncbi:MAG: gamma-glutamyltransferase [Citromicrobium sp.]|nr:MAG: gamma-glutamyltransferase [Citromicrobium sp.]